MTDPTHRSAELDRRIGAALRAERQARGLSMEQVGERLGVTLQQISKYERGQGRIAAAPLLQFLTALDVAIPEFIARIRDPLDPTSRSELEIARRRPGRTVAALHLDELLVIKATADALRVSRAIAAQRARIDAALQQAA